MMYISLQPVDPWNDILSDRTVGSILNCDYYYKSFLLLVFFIEIYRIAFRCNTNFYHIA